MERPYRSSDEASTRFLEEEAAAELTADEEAYALAWHEGETRSFEEWRAARYATTMPALVA